MNGKPVSAELIAAMQLAQKPIYTMPNGNKQAMAWVNNMRGDNPVILKNGGTSAFGVQLSSQRRFSALRVIER